MNLLQSSTRSLAGRMAARRSRSFSASGARPNIVLLGAPGVGKGTYASKIEDYLGINHLSTGDAIREEMQTGSELGRSYQKIVGNGGLVPDDMMNPLIATLVKKNQGGVLLDGYPRTREQVFVLDSLMSVNAAIHLTLREDVLVEKITSRRVCSGCNRGYNLANIVDGDLNMPALLPKLEGICDDCGSPLISRDDDRKDIVTKRLKTHDSLVSGILDEYHQRGILHEIELTSGLREMWPQMQAFLDQIGIASLDQDTAVLREDSS